MATSMTEVHHPKVVSQAEWLAARLEDKPFNSERWVIDYDGKVEKTAIA